MVDNLAENNWDRESCPLYRVERWPRNRGLLSTFLNGDDVVTKVNVRRRQGGRSSGVVVKRGSTVFILASTAKILQNPVQHIGVGAGPAGPVLARPLFRRLNCARASRQTTFSAI